MRSIPGIVGLHAIISSVCRRNRTDEGAVDEALARVRNEIVNTLPNWPLEMDAKFHIIFSVERQAPE